MPLGGLGVCAFVGWQMRRSDFTAQMKMNSKVPAFIFDYISIGIKYVAPAAILIIFIAGLL